MAKRLGFILILSMCLLTVGFARAMESPSPAASPERDSSEEDSPLPPSLSPEERSSPSPETDSSPSPGEDSAPSPERDSSPSPIGDFSPSPPSSPEAESPVDSPSPPPPPPRQSESPSAKSPSPSSSYAPSPEPVSAPADDDADDDTEQETEYFPSPIPSPAPELGKPDDIKAVEAGEELEDESGEDNGLSGLQKAGIVIGTLFGVGAIVIGALVYKKRRDNMTRARYTYFGEGDFL